MMSFHNHERFAQLHVPSGSRSPLETLHSQTRPRPLALLRRIIIHALRFPSNVDIRVRVEVRSSSARVVASAFLEVFFAHNVARTSGMRVRKGDLAGLQLRLVIYIHSTHKMPWNQLSKPRVGSISCGALDPRRWLHVVCTCRPLPGSLTSKSLLGELR